MTWRAAFVLAFASTFLPLLVGIALLYGAVSFQSHPKPSPPPEQHQLVLPNGGIHP